MNQSAEEGAQRHSQGHLIETQGWQLSCCILADSCRERSIAQPVQWLDVAHSDASLAHVHRPGSKSNKSRCYESLEQVERAR